MSISLLSSSLYDSSKTVILIQIGFSLSLNSGGGVAKVKDLDRFGLGKLLYFTASMD